MKEFRCVMCGGLLEVSENQKLATCEYCGSTITIPKLNSDKRVQYYDRANHFLRAGDFDKAMDYFEKIVAEQPEDAEAYWGIVKCRYGITYEEDPLTHEMKPTLNRLSYSSIKADEDYRKALECQLDVESKEFYQTQVEIIENYQKSILEIARNEDAFDIFISYKETDASGNRTRDSVDAQELYYRLVDEGYRVFFSRITLESVLGTSYEPYIFSALHSAKVMVVIGTSAENFHSVWVKNEWMRFLNEIKQGENKTIIPAYRDMDPYDLPIELSHLQAQDMSKLGFMQDIVSGINKIMGKNEKEFQTTSLMNNADSGKLKRAFLFIEDGDFKKANDYLEDILNSNPETAQAYFGKLLIERRATNVDALIQQGRTIRDSRNFKRAISFGNQREVSLYEGYENEIQATLREKSATESYRTAYEMMESQNYLDAGNLFSKLNYKDSEKYAALCFEKNDEKIYQITQDLMNKEEYNQAIVLISEMHDKEKAQMLATECQKLMKEQEEERKTAQYQTLKKKAGVAVTSEEFRQVADGFANLGNFSDSSTLSKYYFGVAEQKVMEEARSARNKKIRSIAFIAIAASLLIGAGSAAYGIIHHNYLVTSRKVIREENKKELEKLPQEVQEAVDTVFTAFDVDKNDYKFTITKPFESYFDLAGQREPGKEGLTVVVNYTFDSPLAERGKVKDLGSRIKGNVLLIESK